MTGRQRARHCGAGDFGDLIRKQATLANVKGFVPYRIPRLWNVWVE